MDKPNFNYEKKNDTLYISFEPPVAATGIELNDHILLRINKAERKAVGLTFFDYSILTQQTTLGPRSFPLTGLDDLSDALRDMVMDILQHSPIKEILPLSAYTPSAIETIPITSPMLHSAAR